MNRSLAAAVAALATVGLAQSAQAYVLWGHEHQHRATNLGAALHETVGNAATYAPAAAVVPTSADATLTIWGHGGPDSFADMTPAQLANLIGRWKTKNASFTTVELVTCDARHTEGGPDSYTDKLMPLLIAGGKVKVKVKSLPRGGSTATVSEFFAREIADGDGWYFIASKDAAAHQQGKDIYTAALAGIAPATPAASVIDEVQKGAATATAAAAKKKAVGFTTGAGHFSVLRSKLVPVTTYRDAAGLVKSVPK